MMGELIYLQKLTLVKSNFHKRVNSTNNRSSCQPIAFDLGFTAAYVNKMGTLPQITFLLRNSRFSAILPRRWQSRRHASTGSSLGTKSSTDEPHDILYKSDHLQLQESLKKVKN